MMQLMKFFLVNIEGSKLVLLSSLKFDSSNPVSLEYYKRGEILVWVHI
jgi:hypothetical protein